MTTVTLVGSECSAVLRIVRRAGNLVLHTLRRADRLSRAASIITGGDNIALREPAVMVGIEAFNRLRLG